MADRIKLNYPMAEQMARTFLQSAQQIDTTISEMKAISETLKNGALLGQGGQAFAEAIDTRFVKSLEKLSSKFIELDGDVKSAISSMRQADEEAKRQFN
jgi:WXG100 family type VII secretion target